jgi:hypothetical protein
VTGIIIIIIIIILILINPVYFLHGLKNAELQVRAELAVHGETVNRSD